MARKDKRPLAILALVKLRKLGDFLIRIKGIVGDIEANVAIFATPVPTLVSVKADIAALEAAQTLAETRVVGSAAARDEKYNIVLDDMHDLLGYVQSLADNAANTGAAITIINSSGFDLKVNGVRVKPPLEVQNTDIAGMVKLIAKAASKRAAYNWQFSINNGVSWTDLLTTIVANTTATGLTPGTRVIFRFRSITKDGASGWSTPVSLIIQ